MTADKKMMLPLLGSLLQQVRAKITDGSDMLWGWYETPEQLRADLDRFIQQLNAGKLSCLEEIHLLFLPTAVFQEHSIQNGWTDEYMRLSSDFDDLYQGLKREKWRFAFLLLKPDPYHMTPAVKSGLLIAVTAITLVAIFLAPPIAQPLSFHHFADTRSLWGIPNFGNVMSNVPFVVIGVYGIWLVAAAPAPRSIRSIYLVLFAGVVLTGLGSAHYHWHPDNDTLVWDRIPMTIVFMSFLAATLAELVNRPLGVRLLVPLVALGITSATSR